MVFNILLFIHACIPIEVGMYPILVQTTNFLIFLYPSLKTLSVPKRPYYILIFGNVINVEPEFDLLTKIQTMLIENTSFSFCNIAKILCANV